MGTVVKRISLTLDNRIGYGHLLQCCNKRQQVHIEELEPGGTWDCLYCEKPMMIRIGDEFFELGMNITI